VEAEFGVQKQPMEREGGREGEKVCVGGIEKESDAHKVWVGRGVTSKKMRWQAPRPISNKQRAEGIK
jgi:hypothetical protein